MTLNDFDRILTIPSGVPRKMFSDPEQMQLISLLWKTLASSVKALAIAAYLKHCRDFIIG